MTSVVNDTTFYTENTNGSTPTTVGTKVFGEVAGHEIITEYMDGDDVACVHNG